MSVTFMIQNTLININFRNITAMLKLDDSLNLRIENVAISLHISYASLASDGGWH